eukprot:COSAG02_NODE_8282_length_2632_cov_51.776272_1_plen_202_part_10
MPRADDPAPVHRPPEGEGVCEEGEPLSSSPALFRSSVGALLAGGVDGPGQSEDAAAADRKGGQPLLRWGAAVVVHSCACAGLWFGMEQLYFGAVGQRAQECDTPFVAGSRGLVHEFIGWAPVAGRNALLLAGLLALCRTVADLERSPGTVQALLLGAGERDGQAAGAGWRAIVGSGRAATQRQPRFEEARTGRGMSRRQARV